MSESTTDPDVLEDSVRFKEKLRKAPRIEDVGRDVAREVVADFRNALVAIQKGEMQLSPVLVQFTTMLAIVMSLLSYEDRVALIRSFLAGQRMGRFRGFEDMVRMMEEKLR